MLECGMKIRAVIPLAGDLETVCTPVVDGQRIATVGDGVAVGQETLGFTLKATRDFAAKEYITQYEGVLVDDATIRAAEAEGGRWSHLASFKGRGGGVDGWKEPRAHRGGGAFANHAVEPNAEIVRETAGIYLRALRHIPAGASVTVSYAERFLRSEKGKAAHGVMLQSGVGKKP